MPTTIFNRADGAGSGPQLPQGLKALPWIGGVILLLIVFSSAYTVDTGNVL